jgi:hypothetical protein
MNAAQTGALLEKLETEIEDLVGLITGTRPTCATPWSDLVNGDPVRDVQAFRQMVEEHLAEKKEEAGEAPCQFLFGFDDPFGNDGLYVWIVAEDFFVEEGCVDDSSSASSVISWKKRTELDDDELEVLANRAHVWLSKATDGILYGEGMESCWDTDWVDESSRKLHAERPEVFGELEDPYEGKTRKQVIEQIKAALIERGFKHEPKLDQDAD